MSAGQGEPGRGAAVNTVEELTSQIRRLRRSMWVTTGLTLLWIATYDGDSWGKGILIMVATIWFLLALSDKREERKGR